MAEVDERVSPRTRAGRRLLDGHGHRPAEGDEPSEPDNVWCAADDEEWPCPFARNLAAIEAEAIALDRAALVAAWEDAKRRKASVMHDVGGVEIVVDRLLAGEKGADHAD